MKQKIRIIAKYTVALLILLVLPYIIHTLSASAGTSTTTVDLQVNIANVPALTITVPSNPLVINLTPNFVGGTFGSTDPMSVTVATSNRTGYTLSMTSTTTSLNRVEASVDGIGGAIESLPAKEGGYTESEFVSDTSLANKWGYSLDSGNYLPLSSQAIISSSTTPTNGITANLKFGVKADASTPSGSYATTLVFTAITNPALYMQNVSEWKDSVAVNQSEQVIDQRDGKVYWVTRLATDPNIPTALPGTNLPESAGTRADCTTVDGITTCSQLWMTQNLDLALGSRTYTHYDTDLGWTTNETDITWTPAATMTDVTNWGAQCLGSDCSYDDGDRYYFTSNSDASDATYTSIELCQDAGNSKTDCEHASNGNYYNFYTATAASTSDGNDVNYNYMANSICPAGWRLPVGLTAADGYSDFDYMLKQNNITESNSLVDADAIYAAGGFKLLRTSPVYLVRAGRAMDTGRFLNGADWGFYWSGTVFNTTKSYNLRYSYGNIYPANGSVKSYGFSVRCIAR